MTEFSHNLFSFGVFLAGSLRLYVFPRGSTIPYCTRTVPFSAVTKEAFLLFPNTSTGTAKWAQHFQFPCTAVFRPTLHFNMSQTRRTDSHHLRATVLKYRKIDAYSVVELLKHQIILMILASVVSGRLLDWCYSTVDYLNDVAYGTVITYQDLFGGSKRNTYWKAFLLVAACTQRRSVYDEYGNEHVPSVASNTERREQCQYSTVVSELQRKEQRRSKYSCCFRSCSSLQNTYRRLKNDGHE